MQCFSTLTVLCASYNILLTTNKSGKLHTISEELILPAAIEVPTSILYKSTQDIIKTICLSNNLVQIHIDEMAVSVEEKLAAY